MTSQKTTTAKSVTVGGHKITAPAESKIQSELERAEWALRGLSRCLQRSAVDGTPDGVIGEAQKLYEQAAEHLEGWQAAVSAFGKVADPAEPLRAARAAAAAELLKKLPSVFPSSADAEVFASRLMFGDASAEGARRQRQKDIADRARIESRKAFWIAVESAANLIAPTGKGSDKALDAVVEAGRFA